jgi:hypothetical protein
VLRNCVNLRIPVAGYGVPAVLYTILMLLPIPRDASMQDLPRKLGFMGSICLVVGTVIGGVIFLVPNLIARNLSSAP